MGGGSIDRGTGQRVAEGAAGSAGSQQTLASTHAASQHLHLHLHNQLPTPPHNCELTHLWVEHHLQQGVQHHVVGHQLPPVNDGLQTRKGGKGRSVWCTHACMHAASWGQVMRLRLVAEPAAGAACWKTLSLQHSTQVCQAGRTLISGLVSSSWLMPMARLSPRLFTMNGMLVPLPDPGAPFSHTTSRGHTRRCSKGSRGGRSGLGGWEGDAAGGQHSASALAGLRLLQHPTLSLSPLREPDATKRDHPQFSPPPCTSPLFSSSWTRR